MSSASGGSVDGSTSIDMEEPRPLRTIDSPFRAGGQGDAHVGTLSSVASVRSMDDMLRLTVRGVEACLDEVRPYLMADGGDVEVVDVQDGVVYLRLQGACSSCPSQTSTMKGGIERIIRATFGDQVRDILQLEATDPGANPQRVDAALNMLRGAIHNWGGAVEVVSVENHVAVLRYKGPPAIGKGVQGAIKEQFKELREVRLVPFEEEGAAAGDGKAGAQGNAGSL